MTSLEFAGSLHPQNGFSKMAPLGPMYYLLQFQKYRLTKGESQGAYP